MAEDEVIDEFKDVARIFKGFLNIVSDANKRIDQLLELSITAEVTVVPHYSSQKKKNNAVIGQTSRAIITFDDASSLYAVKNTTPNVDTITHITNKLNNELETVPFVFESVQETDHTDTDNKFILYKFRGDIIRSTLVRNTSSGTYEGELELDITSEDQHVLSNALPPEIP